MNIAERRKLRAEFDRCDNVVEYWEKSLKSAEKNPSGIEATPEDLAISRTAEITVSVKWLAAVLGHANRAEAIDTVLERL